MVSKQAADNTAPMQIDVTSVAGKKVVVATRPIQIDSAVRYAPATRYGGRPIELIGYVVIKIIGKYLGCGMRKRATQKNRGEGHNVL